MNSSDNTPAPPLEDLAPLRARMAELERCESEDKQLEEALAERMRLLALSREVSVALIQSNTLQESLHQCAQAVVDHLGAAFARIWTLNTTTQMLELQASAGMYTHLDGPHSRVPIGKLKIGLIAAERQPHLSNAVIGDPRISDQDWAKREGMVAFAGYPLIIEGHLVGVMALFARTPLFTAVIDAIASIANVLALGIERKRVEEERSRLLVVEQQARAEAEAALQVRNDFLSSLSHDLKTPLTSIKGCMQLMRRWASRTEVVDSLRLKEALTLIEGATTKMTAMIEELLDMARLQSGEQLELNLRLLDLMELAQREAADLQPTTKRHQIRVEATVPELLVLGDPLRLDRVLANLLSNAIKYSPQGGQITVTLSQVEQGDHSWAVLLVEDQGLGIPAADLPHIFDPFHRGDNVAGRIQGSGIGLASVFQIVQQHGGMMTVASEEGKGSTFTVRLPLKT